MRFTPEQRLEYYEAGVIVNKGETHDYKALHVYARRTAAYGPLFPVYTLDRVIVPRETALAYLEEFAS